MSNKVDPRKRYVCKVGSHPLAVFLKPDTPWPLTPGAKVSYRPAEASSNALWLHGVVTVVHPDGYFYADKI